MKSTYDTQAESFLTKFGIRFRATLSDSKPCPWKYDDKMGWGSGHHYRVTLSRPSRLVPGQLNGKPTGLFFQVPHQRLVFDFWGSTHDAKAGIKTVTAYDVLACVSGDAYCPDSFKDFCAEYGYEQDSIKALQTYRRCSSFSKRLRAFFTEQELTELQEIR